MRKHSGLGALPTEPRSNAHRSSVVRFLQKGRACLDANQEGFRFGYPHSSVVFPHIIHGSPEIGRAYSRRRIWGLDMRCTLLEDDFRNKLDAIWLRYQIDRNAADKREYLRLLKQFRT